jgi:hypothetical protein
MTHTPAASQGAVSRDASNGNTRSLNSPINPSRARGLHVIALAGRECRDAEQQLGHR